MKVIKYNFPREGDNTEEVLAFIGQDTYTCPTCGNTGEYVDYAGVHGCMLCSSRLIPFTKWNGADDTLDWGEYLCRNDNGLVKVPTVHCMEPGDSFCRVCGDELLHGNAVRAIPHEEYSKMREYLEKHGWMRCCDIVTG